MSQPTVDPMPPGGATSARALGGDQDRARHAIGGDDWPARLTQALVGYVQVVRSNTTGRALRASRMAVYALALGPIAVVATVVLIIGLFRLFALVAQGYIWAVYLGFGVVFLLAGLFAWSRMERTPHRS